MRLRYASVPGLILIALTVFLALLFQAPLSRVALYSYEDIRLASDPSAQRAFSYGERHFSARTPLLYDVVRAEYFYEQAREFNPAFPGVSHELARIAFLKGNFELAMERINTHIEQYGDLIPSSYYIRGLIEGYAGDYDAAAKDYETFLQYYPHNWAALNDYAWVLLKAGRPRDALNATARGLARFPNNAWLLNSSAIALYELEFTNEAYEQAQRAVAATKQVTVQEWLEAYPGNDPRIAGEGIAALRQSALDNMHIIELALASSTVQ